MKTLISEVLREACGCEISPGVKFMLQLEYGKQSNDRDQSSANGTYVWRGEEDCTYVPLKPFGRERFNERKSSQDDGKFEEVQRYRRGIRLRP